MPGRRRRKQTFFFLSLFRARLRPLRHPHFDLPMYEKHAIKMKSTVRGQEGRHLRRRGRCGRGIRTEFSPPFKILDEQEKRKKKKKRRSDVVFFPSKFVRGEE